MLEVGHPWGTVLTGGEQSHGGAHCWRPVWRATDQWPSWSLVNDQPSRLLAVGEQSTSGHPGRWSPDRVVAHHWTSLSPLCSSLLAGPTTVLLVPSSSCENSCLYLVSSEPPSSSILELGYNGLAPSQPRLKPIYTSPFPPPKCEVQHL